MKTILLMCWEFFKTGLFAVGGGMATLPFLTEMSENHPDWFSKAQLADMVAVAESTPGPIGINMATYAGYSIAKIPGAFLATFSLVLPSFLVLVMIGRMLDKYMKNKYVLDVFKGLRPAVTGLIAAAGFSVWKLSLINVDALKAKDFAGFISIPALIIFAAVLFLCRFKKTSKIHPIVYIGVCAAVGIVLKL